MLETDQFVNVLEGSFLTDKRTLKTDVPKSINPCQCAFLKQLLSYSTHNRSIKRLNVVKYSIFGEKSNICVAFHRQIIHNVYIT